MPRESNPLPTRAILREIFDYREDGNLIWRVALSPKVKIGDVVGSDIGRGYRQTTINYLRYLVHRLIWQWHYDDCPPMLDHINMDPSDNRVENLRPITRGHNKRRTKAGTVRQRPSARGPGLGRWEGYVRMSGKVLHVGTFDSEAEARAATRAYYESRGVRCD
jgi:hypothetical protein